MKESKDTINQPFEESAVGLSSAAETQKTQDVVNHPPHYNQGGIECIDYIEQQLGHAGFTAYLEGNVIKYMHRWRYKNGQNSKQDLEKARWYLNKLINLI